MPVIKRELHRTAKGPLMNEDAWWYLARDTDSGRVFVLHEWDRADMREGAASNHATVEIKISAFLSDDGPAQRELRRLIGMLVEG